MAVYSEIRDDKNNEKNKIIEKKINGLFTINRKTLGSSGSVKVLLLRKLKMFMIIFIFLAISFLF